MCGVPLASLAAPLEKRMCGVTLGFPSCTTEEVYMWCHSRLQYILYQSRSTLTITRNFVTTKNFGVFVSPEVFL